MQGPYYDMICKNLYKILFYINTILLRRWGSNRNSKHRDTILRVDITIYSDTDTFYNVVLRSILYRYYNIQSNFDNCSL